MKGGFLGMKTKSISKYLGKTARSRKIQRRNLRPDKRWPNKINERLDFIIWEEKNVTDPDLIIRIYPKSLFVEDREEGRKAFFLTDKCYTPEELNKELDLFQNDLKNIRKKARRKFDEFNKKK
ncbi:unnamed protein product, partial [marine sediment metagenome]